jgi:hypothetical protein
LTLSAITNVLKMCLVLGEVQLLVHKDRRARRVLRDHKVQLVRRALKVPQVRRGRKDFKAFVVK